MWASNGSRRSMKLLFFALCSLCLCGGSPAALDPELQSPYLLHVVLSVAEHRMRSLSWDENPDQIDRIGSGNGHVALEFRNRLLLLSGLRLSCISLAGSIGR